MIYIFFTLKTIFIQLNKIKTQIVNTRVSIKTGAEGGT